MCLSDMHAPIVHEVHVRDDVTGTDDVHATKEVLAVNRPTHGAE